MINKIFLTLIGLTIIVNADFDRHNGIILDFNTGFEWQDNYSDNSNNIKESTWSNAIKYCQELNLGNKSDWRLPSRKELLTIVDKNRNRPAIDSTFRKTSSNFYWSIDRFEGKYVWGIDFFYGSKGRYDENNEFLIRCVREDKKNNNF